MTKFGKRISGQALVEHLVLWPALVLVTMSLIQAGFLYRGKTTLEHATFMAAREGSLQHAFKAPMKKTLAQGMASLDVRANPGTGTYTVAAGAAGVPGTTYAKHFHLTKAAGGADITIISPSRSAFNQFAREQYILCTDDNSCRNGNVVEKSQRMRQIPNDNLSVRPATTHSVSVQGGSASLNLQDANLLKIRSHWCFGLEVPIVNAALYRTLTALGTLTAEQRSCIARTEAARALGQTTYYIPLSASSIVRMQSAVRCEDSSCSNLGTGGVLAGTGSGGPGGTPGSGNPGTGNPGSHPPGNGNPGSGNNPGGGTTNPPPTDPVPLCTPEENSEPVATTPSEDSGVLGDIWDALKDMAGTAQDFIRGFWDGIKDQVGDLAHMITNPLETAQGLYELAMAFIEDPVETAKALGEALGQDLSQLIQCGAYDRGRVLGNYVSPAAMLKIATKLAKFGRTAGGYRKALKEAKEELEAEGKLGCASFAAGTPVATPRGPIAIDQLTGGTPVASRSGKRFTDKPQKVKTTFHRTAPTYHHITTEHDQFDVTPEHPFWVQGEGWVAIKDIRRGTPVATATGDTMIMTNDVIDRPLAVYNIAVHNTPSYFVGEERVWVHNANCDTGGGPKGSPLPAQHPTTASNGLIYQSNPKHTPGQPGNRPDAGIEPRNSIELFGKSIPGSKTYPNKEVRFAVDEHGNVHRFEGTNGIYHWNGSTGDAKNPLRGDQVPNDIQEKLGVKLR